MRRPGSIVHLKKTMRRIIYRLKWVYGFPMDLYTETLGEYNPSTGKRTTTRTKIHIDRTIVFPGTAHRNFFFSISVIRANSNFVTGGDIQADDRQFIIDARDIPPDLIVDIERNYVIWENKRWNFVSIYNLEGDTGYYIVGRKISNQLVNQIFDDNYLKDKLTLTSTFTGGF